MKQLIKALKCLLACGLCIALEAQTLPKEIAVIVVEGEGVVNRLKQRVAHDPVVRVEDDQHRPITGAAVVFTLPVSGATGEFVNGSKTLTVMTDKDGQAVAQGLKTNQVSGKLQIYVTASYRGLRARTLVNQFTMEPAGSADTARARKGGSGKTWAILAVLGAAAAAGGAVAATHKGSTPASSGTPTAPVPAVISISPGSGSVGAPR